MFSREDEAGISYQEEMENSAWKDTDVDLSSVAVIQKLRNLKADKSPAPDGIGVRRFRYMTISVHTLSVHVFSVQPVSVH